MTQYETAQTEYMCYLNDNNVYPSMGAMYLAEILGIGFSNDLSGDWVIIEGN